MTSIAISAAHPLAVDAAREVTSAGGNAVDAAIAAQAMIAVVLPQSAGLGGDGLNLVSSDYEVLAINGTGLSPASWPQPDLTQVGQQVTVPGVVQSWFDLQERFGNVSVATSLAPAIRAARDGIVVDGYLMKSINGQRARIEIVSAEDPVLALALGETWGQPELAALLESISVDGPSAFYEGAAAEAICRAIARHGGSMVPADLAGQRSEIGAPLAAPWAGGEVLVQPPSSQGVLLAVALKWLDEHYASLDAASLDHVMAELTTAIFEFRDDAALGAALFDRPLAVDVDRATKRQGPRAYLHTAGVATADSAGTIVSSLVSVFDSFGSAIWVPELGIHLNDRGAGFTAGRNAPRAGARPIHTLAPAMVTTPEGRYAIATPGADGQVQTILQVLAAVRGGASPASAISADRWRSQDGTIVIPDEHPARTDLGDRGHALVAADSGAELFGAVVCAGSDGDGLFAEADWRRQTTATVFDVSP